MTTDMERSQLSDRHDRGDCTQMIVPAFRRRVTFNIVLPNSTPMKAEKQPELVWQCLNCHKTYKGPDAEQKALDCCGSIVQGWWANYNKWGKQKWYGR